MPYVALTFRLTLLATFALSASGKVGRRRLRAFSASLVSLHVAGPPAAPRLARAVLAAEVATAALLAAPFRAAGFVAAGAMLVVLSVGVGLALRRGAHAPCRCFGGGSAPLGRRHLARNIVLIAIAASGAITDVRPADSSHPAGVALAVCAALVAVLVIRFFDEIAAAFTPASPARR